MKTVCLIQARAGSVRLPGKAFLKVGGRSLIGHVVGRVAAITGIDDVIVCVPRGDGSAFDAVMDSSVVCVAPGDVADEDVLGRLARAVSGIAPDVVVRVTGDCPLFAPDVAAAVLQRFHEEGADFASNDTRLSGWPDGTDVEVFTRALLDRAARDATLLYDREHVTPWMQRAVGVRATVWRSAVDYSGLKLSVDTREDFERVARIVAQLEPDDLSFHATIAAAKKAGLWK